MGYFKLAADWLENQETPRYLAVEIIDLDKTFGTKASPKKKPAISNSNGTVKNKRFNLSQFKKRLPYIDQIFLLELNKKDQIYGAKDLKKVSCGGPSVGASRSR